MELEEVGWKVSSWILSMTLNTEWGFLTFLGAIFLITSIKFGLMRLSGITCIKLEENERKYYAYFYLLMAPAHLLAVRKYKYKKLTANTEIQSLLWSFETSVLKNEIPKTSKIKKRLHFRGNVVFLFSIIQLCFYLSILANFLVRAAGIGLAMDGIYLVKSDNGVTDCKKVGINAEQPIMGIHANHL